MKKLLFLLIIIICIISCATTTTNTTTDSNDLLKVGIINHKYVDDPDGNYNFYEIIIADEIKSNDEYLCIFNKYVFDDETRGTYYMINFRYYGSSWKNLNGFELKVDDKIFRVDDFKPYRNTSDCGFVENVKGVFRNGDDVIIALKNVKK